MELLCSVSNQCGASTKGGGEDAIGTGCTGATKALKECCPSARLLQALDKNFTCEVERGFLYFPKVPAQSICT